ncbi:Chromate resistance protein ChrB [Cellulomonas endophytica]|uniref:Chromate resistance protein ChrB n=1 Tax=Cellulomonas endophytica TaxID=2494735 RepID=UPI00196A48E8|nr:Chromate resistance protein ChrB [Cellulomonas endophytica]
MDGSGSGGGAWVLLTYHLPREPSTPRIAVWRQLRRLGVAQLADGLVALPADARTREAMDRTADRVRAAGGTAGVWLARPGAADQERELARGLREARAEEYRGIAARASAAVGTPEERRRAAERLRAELRRVRRRDFFPPPEREAAVAAVEALAAGGTGVAPGTARAALARVEGTA